MEKVTAKLKAFLLWTQKYTKSDMLYLFKGGFWLTLGQVGGSGLILLVTILSANLLPKETYGTYKYVLSIVGILMIATLPQMATAVTQSVARGFEGTLQRMLKPKFLYGCLGSVASLGLAVYYAQNGNGSLAAGFLIVAVFLPFFAALQLYDAFLLGRKLFDVSAKYSVIIQAFSAAAFIVAALTWKSVTALLIAYFASRTLVTAALFARMKAKFKPNAQVDPEAETYGKHMTLLGGIATVANYLDSVLVYHYLGATQLAIYAIAVGPPNQLKGLLGNIDTLIFPNFSKRPDRELRAAMNRKFLNLFILGVVVIGAYVLAAPFLYGIIFPKYQESVLYSQLFSLSMLNMTFFPAETYLRAKKKIKEQYLTNLFASVFQIAAMAVGVIKWGLLGLVVGRILSRYVGTLISLYFYHRTPIDSDGASAQPAVSS